VRFSRPPEGRRPEGYVTLQAFIDSTDDILEVGSFALLKMAIFQCLCVYKGLSGYSLLYLLDDPGETRCILYSELRKHLSVQDDPCLFHPVDKLAI